MTNKRQIPNAKPRPHDERRIKRYVTAISILGVALVAAWPIVRGRLQMKPANDIEVDPPVEIARELSAPVVHFTDITEVAGIDFVRFNGATGEKLLPETMGGGGGFLDFDNDGDPDLLLINGAEWPHNSRSNRQPASALYRNEGNGRFTNVSGEAGLDLQLQGMGVAVGDYDGDGWIDLYITAVGENRLMRNMQGRFQDLTATAGVGGEHDAWSTCGTFIDIDNDRDLDLFVCNYVRWSPQIDLQVDYQLTGIGRAYGPPFNYEGSHPVLYRNEGNGTFTDISAEAGVRIQNPATGLPTGKSLGVAPIDLDRDGWLDLIVANDTVGNFFFRNLGSGTFEEIGEISGMAYDRNGSATGGMGIDIGDYRNDGETGILIGNFANEMTGVYVTQGDPGIFADEAIVEGIGAPTRTQLTFGVLLLDFDLDGRLDLLQNNGHLDSEIGTVDPSQSYTQTPQLFWNAGWEGKRTFEPVDAATTGDLSQAIVGRGSAYADIEGDGDLDLLLLQASGRPLLLRNDQTQGHHWVRLRLQDSPPNDRSAIGARVELASGGVVQQRTVTPTRSYLSVSETVITFGLGASETIDSLIVTWPDGTEQTVDEILVDRESRVTRRPSAQGEAGRREDPPAESAQ